MYNLIKKIIKIVILLLVIALVFDLHYQGQSIRQWSKDYGVKISAWLYDKGKDLVGKDLKDLTPSSLPRLEKSLKSLTNDADQPEKKNEVKKSLEDAAPKDQSMKAETQRSNVTKLDQLTDQDRAKLKELLEQKSKNSKTSSLQ